MMSEGMAGMEWEVDNLYKRMLLSCGYLMELSEMAAK